MPKILILDTLYDSFLRSFYVNPAASYDTELKRLLEFSFGTSDFYSRNLRMLGWDVADAIVNSDDLQTRWAFEHGVDPSDVLKMQVEAFRPDVVLLQDLSIDIHANALLAAQCSCALPSNESLIKRCEVVFTSLPTHLEEFDRLGVRAEFLPLAFDPITLERTGEPAERDIDVSFVGALSGWQWNKGTKLLKAVAEAIPTARFYGYGYENAPTSVRDKFCGPAFGNDMYSIYRRSKIVLNRHGEITRGFSNNLRLFEATGMGALLLTEQSKNISDYFSASECVSYSSPEEAVYSIREALKNDATREEIARNGQARTLRDHTYLKRMEKVSEVLKGMLCAAYP